MPATIVIGAQWGDEGKGRVADWLAAEADVVARYAGGDNAGHTVVVGEKVFKLHLVPSGILHDHVVCVLGNGMVVNPVNLLKEMDQIRAMGVDVSPERFIISSRAHLITPAHVALDSVSEKALGNQAIGTTLRGIGPAYMDKTGRKGIRAGQMLRVEDFAEALYNMIEQANVTLARQGGVTLDPKTVTLDYLDAASRLQPYIKDTTVYLNQQLQKGARVLCEGAQGTLLDIDHGDYPFVTSSSPTAGGAMTGLGIGPRYIDKVMGVGKCFSTRVGSGPMPTELEGELGNRLRGTGENHWDEFGTTTGRPRRCGWLDVVVLRYAAAVNGFTDLFLTKLDVLSGFEELKIAVAYKIDGQRYEYPPATLAELERAEAEYITLPGWSEDISRVKDKHDLPEATRAYVQKVAELCQTPISTISVGPERDQLIHF
ncbi:MAG: adenylosuccinate synthase [Chloroflexi bacterium]|nr:adenylosuccinate synthase [Chloroflexota bacterium]MCC6895530.1 adenylosuccinate synthase [Anaerolineae bacterium]